MATTREQQARHQRVRRIVLARFQAEDPDRFAAWWLEARAQVEADAARTVEVSS